MLSMRLVSKPLRQQLHTLGFTKRIIVGTGNYIFTIKGRHQ
jgi:hypothetical protein